MTNNTSFLLSFLLVLIIFVVGGTIVAQQVRDDSLGDYAFLWRNATDNTFINESAYLNLSTQRTSVKFDGNLTVTYDGGDNRTDKVYIDGTFISNITAGRSPETYSVLGSLIDVPCEVHYVFNASATNVTKTDLDYYSYDGCDYAEDTCDSLASSFIITGAIFRIPPFLIFLVVVLIIGGVIMSMIR